MGQIERRNFELGWQPDADAINAPVNAFLRFDNCVIDGLGAVALRPGSAKINSTALVFSYGKFNHTSAFETRFVENLGRAQYTADWEMDYLVLTGHPDGPANHNYDWEADQNYISTTLPISDVHSLYTAVLSGSRYRMAGVANVVYANSASICQGISGSDDISFGAHQGHILFARSSSKKKFDGTSVTNWGIAAPSAALTLATLSSDSKTLATCDSSESPAFTGNEGTVGFDADKAGNANSALSLTPDATTNRATATKTFGGATDFSTYTAGGIGTDDDLIEFDLFVTEPQYLVKFVLMIDVNDGTFESDYYSYEFINGEPINVELTPEEYLKSDFVSEGFDRADLLSRLESRAAVTGFRSDKPITNTGWNHFSVPRGKMGRFGLTSGKDWSTVKAIRVIEVATQGGSGALARVDQIQLTGGSTRPLTGTYKAVVVAVRENGTYQALSGPSPASTEIVVKAQGIRATLPAAATNLLDSQVTELWLYLMGGRTDAFYRYAVLTGGPFSGATTIDATVSDRTAMIANLRLETDNAVPPDDIIGIEGPHFDRTFVLTATHLYPSRQLNPDSFAAGEVVRIGDVFETALWVKKLSENMYVGTTRDIYRMDGDWTPQPDGTVNVVKRPLGVKRPPVSKSVTVGSINGADSLVYLTSEGWQVLSGPLLNSGQMELLWRGETRHDVSPVNITGSTARFRCAITHNTLYAITPEGSDTTSSVRIHAYRFDKQRWYRWTYTPDWRSIAAEPSGVLIGGDLDAFVWTLDEATNQDDGSDIPVVLWTHADDNEELFTSKEASALLLRAETGTATATVGLHLDGSGTANATVTTAQGISNTGSLDVSGVDLFRQIQLRLTGSFSTFNFRGWLLTYLDRPLPKKIHDTGFVDLTDTTLALIRRINIKARAAANLTVTPYYDGTAGTARTVIVDPDREVVYPVPLGREDKGTTTRVVITSPQDSYIYWVEFEYNVSGKQRQKRIAMTKEAA